MVGRSWVVAVLAGLLGVASVDAADGEVLKAALRFDARSTDLLRGDGWRAYEHGFRRDGATFVCANGTDAAGRRGVTQTVVLNQTRPEPLVAVAWSKADGVSGTSNSDYSIYLDLVYQDGSTLWGQAASLTVGTHDWQRRQVVVVPDKPVRSVAFYLLFRGHAGTAAFRDARLHPVRAPGGATLFDGVPVAVQTPPAAGFQLRDVAAGSDFVRLDRAALGVTLTTTRQEQGGATVIDATVTDTTGKDRAITLVYALPVSGKELRWLADPRRSEPVDRGERMDTSRFRAGANGRLSHYPFGAVAAGTRGAGLGIDMAHPAFYRVGYNAGTRELFLAYDLALTREKPSARVRLCHWSFDPAWGFPRAGSLLRTVPRRLPLPHAGARVVDAVREDRRRRGWKDFGFRFKEGTTRPPGTMRTAW
ncbi:MAG: hypothetical protein U0736_16210 [Gemmataceae bacterium]